MEAVQVTLLRRTMRIVSKFLASYITEHNTTTVTSLFLYIVSASLSALVPSFLHLLYSSLLEDSVTALSLENCVPRSCFFFNGNQQKARAGLANMVECVITHIATFSHSRCCNTLTHSFQVTVMLLSLWMTFFKGKMNSSTRMENESFRNDSISALKCAEIVYKNELVTAIVLCFFLYESCSSW